MFCDDEDAEDDGSTEDDAVDEEEASPEEEGEVSRVGVRVGDVDCGLDVFVVWVSDALDVDEAAGDVEEEEEEEEAAVVDSRVS